MQKYFDVLRTSELFLGMSDAELSALMHCLGGRVLKYGRGDMIFSEGSAARYIGIVLEGSVQMTSIDYYGNRNIIGELASGELFCEEFAALDLPEIPVSCSAKEDCSVVKLECSRILRACGQSCTHHHAMIYNLMRSIAKKSLSLHERMEITSKRTTREKLLTYLAIEAKRQGRNSFDIPFDRQELADYLEVDRSGLSTEIGKLVREGVVAVRRRHFSLR